MEDEVPEDAKLKGYHPYWHSKPGGRGGVAILSKVSTHFNLLSHLGKNKIQFLFPQIMPHHVEYGIENEEMDEEGRLITAEYEKFYLICVYVPNAGNKLVTLPKRLRWNKLFDQHLRTLNEKKPVIICGDMNVAHNEIGKLAFLTNEKKSFNPKTSLILLKKQT